MVPGFVALTIQGDCTHCSIGEFPRHITAINDHVLTMGKHGGCTRHPGTPCPSLTWRQAQEPECFWIKTLVDSHRIEYSYWSEIAPGRLETSNRGTESLNYNMYWHWNYVKQWKRTKAYEAGTSAWKQWCYSSPSVGDQLRRKKIHLSYSCHGKWSNEICAPWLRACTVIAEMMNIATNSKLKISQY